MAYIRSATVLGLLLTLLVTACNRAPEGHLEKVAPQFGETTPGLEAARHLAVSTDGVFVGGTWNNRQALIKFSRKGGIPWITRLPQAVEIKDVVAGPEGSVYVIFVEAYTLGGPDLTRNLVLQRYDRNGIFVWTRALALDIGRFVTTSAAADKNGTLYVFTSFGSSSAPRTELRSYRSDGTLVWRKLADEYTYDLDVSANGFIHTVSSVYPSDDQRLTRYKPDGTPLWNVPIPFVNDVYKVAVGRENEIYLASNDEEFQFDWYTRLAKYDSRGARVWTRKVQNNIGLRLDGFDADTQGNVFLALTNPNLDVEKPSRFKEFYTYSPGGKRLVYERFDFGTEAPLVGPAALSPTEVYLATSGVGAEGRDGLLLRLGGLTGNVTWRR